VRPAAEERGLEQHRGGYPQTCSHPRFDVADFRGVQVVAARLLESSDNRVLKTLLFSFPNFVEAIYRTMAVTMILVFPPQGQSTLGLSKILQHL